MKLKFRPDERNEEVTVEKITLNYSGMLSTESLTDFTYGATYNKKTLVYEAIS